MLNIKFYKPSGTGLDQSIGDEIMFTSCIGLVRFTMIKPILSIEYMIQLVLGGKLGVNNKRLVRFTMIKPILRSASSCL